MTLPTVGLVLGTIDPNVPAAPSGDQNVKFQGQIVPPGAPVQYVSAYPQTATISLRGVVKPDGTTIAVDGAGTLSAASPVGGAVLHTGNYTAVAADCGVIQVFNSATAVTLTLPAAAPFLKWTLPVQNVGAGVLTINRNGLTIDTVAANLTLNQASGVNLATDGTNYFTERGMAIASGLATISAIQQESYTSGTDTGTANAYAVTLSPAPTIGAYSELTFIVGHTNTGPSTVAVNGGTAIAVKKQGSVALAAGDWPAGLMVTVKNDGTFWQWGGGGSGGGGSSPLTTKGDLYGFDTANNRIPIGSNAQVLTADSTQALGLKWATPGGGGNMNFTGAWNGSSAYSLDAVVTYGGSTYLNISAISAPSGASFVQANSAVNATSVAFASNVTVGNLLVMFANANGSTDPITVTDTLGTVWTKAAAQTGANSLACYYGIATASGANTVSYSGATSFNTIAIAEFHFLTTTANSAQAYNSASPSTVSASG